MSGQAMNRGGLRIEWHADIENPAFRWTVRMRYHEGRGVTAEAAFDELIEEIEREAATARAARETYVGPETEG